MLKRNNVIKLCDALLKKQRENQDVIANLGRERDYKVNKINSEYNSQIEECSKKDEALALQIQMVKQYVAAMSYDTAVDKVTKKKG